MIASLVPPTAQLRLPTVHRSEMLSGVEYTLNHAIVLNFYNLQRNEYFKATSYQGLFFQAASYFLFTFSRISRPKQIEVSQQVILSAAFFQRRLAWFLIHRNGNGYYLYYYLYYYI